MLLRFLSLFLFYLISVTAAEAPILHICTVATKRAKGLNQLLDSCKRFKIKPDILGMGKSFKGTGQKFSYVKEYLESLPDEDVVLFMDAYDVLVLADEAKILDTFLEMDSPCVFAAEMQLHPRKKYKQYAQQFLSGPTKFKYINPGTYIGYVYALKEILETMDYSEEASDKAAIIPYYLEHRESIVLDHECRLFCPLQGVRQKDLACNADAKTVFCALTGTEPCLVHGNYKSKNLYQWVYDKLFPESQYPTSG